MGPIFRVICLAAAFMLETAFSETSIPQSCDYQLLTLSNQNDGYLMSPNYPKFYNPGYCIKWVYFGKPGTIINIRLLDIDIPSHFKGVCSNDYLMVGPYNKQKYCGTKSFSIYRAQLTSQLYWFYVIFFSFNTAPKGKGFKLYYQFISSINTSSTTESTPASTTALSTEYPWNHFYDRTTDCQFILTSEAGFISTNNATVLSCLERTGRFSWLVFTPGPGAASINYQLHFKHCYLPSPDNLRIYDGYSSMGPIVSISSNICSSYIASSNHGFFIEYLRGDGEPFPSFIMQFVIVQPSTNNLFPELPKYRTSTEENTTRSLSNSCVFQVNDDSGEISSDRLFSSSGHNAGYCSWLLYTPASDGHQVVYSLNFVLFKLSMYSFIRVYDGADVTAPSLGTYSYELLPFSLTSSQNKVLIQYSPGINAQTATDVFAVKFSAYVRCAQGFESCGYGEFSCFHEDNRCDWVWNCPLHGGDERGCTTACPADFSCDYSSSYCYTENDRCNGKGTCSNYMDEMGCTEDNCSPSKGLYLCRNGRCIYEKWRCDRMSDCFDSSDEEDCSVLSSPRVIVAAVVGSLLCSLLLVIAVGCVCKVYNIRTRQFRGGPPHETPLTRQLAEMFYHRAPPPPYHEAMLTSRPYDQAYLELLNQTEHLLGDSSSSTDHDAGFSPSGERNSLNSGQVSIRSRQYLRRVELDSNQHFQSNSERHAEVEDDPLLIDICEGNFQTHNSPIRDAANNTEPPPYIECDPSDELLCSYIDVEAIGIDNADIVADGASNTSQSVDSHSRSVDSQSVNQTEPIPPLTTHRSVDPTLLSLNSCLRHSNMITRDPECNLDNSNTLQDNTCKNTEISTTTSLSNDNSQIRIDDDTIKFMPSLNIIDEDSDSDCILDDINVDNTSNFDDDKDDESCILDKN